MTSNSFNNNNNKKYKQQQQQQQQNPNNKTKITNQILETKSLPFFFYLPNSDTNYFPQKLNTCRHNSSSKLIV